MISKKALKKKSYNQVTYGTSRSAAHIVLPTFYIELKPGNNNKDIYERSSPLFSKI